MSKKPLSERLKSWGADRQHVGKANLDLLMPHFDKMLLDTYNRGVGMSWTSLPPEVANDERFKLGRITTGTFDAEYFSRQQGIIENVAKNIDYFDYTGAYSFYACNLVNTLLESRKWKDEGARRQAVECLLSSIFSDLAVTMTFFIDNIEATAAAQRNKLAEEFRSDVQNAMEGLQVTMRTIKDNSEDLRKETEAVHKKVSNNNTGPDRVIENVQSIAASTTELSATIREISGQLENSINSIGLITSSVGETLTTKDSLLEASEQIGRITEMIEAIANQTNLLALNATIEAARAGEAGKGFAVVAAEVKGLANEAKHATDEISTQIAGLRNIAAVLADSLDMISTSVTDLNEGAGTISTAIKEQESAANEISSRSERSTIEVSDMAEDARMTAGVAESSSRLANETASNAVSAENTAKAINKVMATFLERLEKAS